MERDLIAYVYIFVQMYIYIFHFYSNTLHTRGEEGNLAFRLIYLYHFLTRSFVSLCIVHVYIYIYINRNVSLTLCLQTKSSCSRHNDATSRMALQGFLQAPLPPPRQPLVNHLVPQGHRLGGMPNGASIETCSRDNPAPTVSNYTSLLSPCN